jgi:chromosome segregation ATPase
MNRLERALWEALNVAITRADGGGGAAAPEFDWKREVEVLRADLEAVCRERDAALEREGELQRRIPNLEAGVDGCRTEVKKLRAKLETCRWELDEARAVARAEIDEARKELDRVRSERDTYKAARDDLARGKEGYATADAMRLFGRPKTPPPTAD